MDKRILIIVSLGILFSLIFVRIDEYPYSIDCQNLHDAAIALLKEGSFKTKEFIPNSIKIGDYYYPAQPIGYSLISIPAILLFKLDKPFFQDILIFDEHWKILENIWDIKAMPTNANIFFLSDSKKILILNFTIEPFYKPRTLEIFLNGEKTYSKLIENKENISIALVTSPGRNTISFNSKDCDIISEVTEREENFCASFFISPIKWEIKPFPKTLEIVFQKGWYNKESLRGITWRWMSANSTLYIFNPGKSTEKLLILKLYSYHTDRHLTVLFNQKLLNTYLIPAHKERKLEIKLNLLPGVNVIHFIPQEGCDIPAKVENSTDERCLSFAFTQLEIELI